MDRRRSHIRGTNSLLALLVNNFTSTELYGDNDGIQLRFYVENIRAYKDRKKYPGNRCVSRTGEANESAS